MVLDVERANPMPGTRVFTFPRHGRHNQQWYFDDDKGTIRSRLNDLCLDFEGGQLVLNQYKADDQNQQWERKGKLIANRKHSNMVLDIDAENKQQGAKVINYAVHNGPNQCWKFELV
jgi:hypothetical protein